MNRSTQYAACLLLAGGIGSHAFAQPPQHDAHPAHAAAAAQHASRRTACDPSHAAMGHCTPASAAIGKDASTQHAASADPHAHDRHDAEEAAQGKRHAMPTCTPGHAAMGHCTPAPAGGQGHHAHATGEPPAAQRDGGHAGRLDHGASQDHTPHRAHCPAGPATDCTPEHAAMGHCTLDHGAAPAAPTAQPGVAPSTPRPHAHGHAPDQDQTARRAHAPTGKAAGCTPDHAAMGHCSPGPEAGHARGARPHGPAAPAQQPRHHAHGELPDHAAHPTTGHVGASVHGCTAEHAAMGHCRAADTPAAHATPDDRTAPPGPRPHAHAAGHDHGADSGTHHARHHADAASGCAPGHAAMGRCPPPRGAGQTGGAKLRVTGPDTQRPDDHVHSEDHAMHGAQAPMGAAPACTPEHAAMGHCTPARDPERTDGARPDREGPAGQQPRAHAHGQGHARPGAEAAAGCPPEHAAMGHCTPAPRGNQEPREPIPVVTQADREAAFPVLTHGHMAHGQTIYTRVKFNRFEAWDSDAASGQAWEGSASVGGDIHRLWLRSSGSRSAGRTTAANAELRWSKAVARWWDVVAGVRHDAEPGPSRTRGALGIQGIAPYQFEVSALAYFGDGGLAAKLEAEYDMRFTNRLVLQPLVEVELHAQDDSARGIGSGLSKAEAGLRLRYEITRRFAPYVGIAHERTFGRTARFHGAEGEEARETRLVAGVRFWF